MQTLIGLRPLTMAKNDMVCVCILCASKKTGATAESVMSIGYDCTMVGQLTN